jgi:hypothetical protein
VARTNIENELAAARLRGECDSNMRASFVIATNGVRRESTKKVQARNLACNANRL